MNLNKEVFLAFLFSIIGINFLYGDEVKFYSLFEEYEEIEIKEGVKEYKLKRNMLFENKEIIIIENQWLKKEQDYKIDYSQGTIYLLKDFLASSKMIIYYEFFPFSISSYYGEKKPEVKEGEIEQEIPIVGLPQEAQTYPSAGVQPLMVGGAKTIAVSLGSEGGMAIDQSLRLNISGEVGENLKVNALLSDQSIPLQPEGTTAELEELDKVFIQISGENLEATLGDYDISFGDTEFARYTKKLEGAKFRGMFGQSDFSLFGATSQGKYTSITFKGQERVQGPYPLKVGGQTVIILAGTEVVWVDDKKTTAGLKKMMRGLNNDYTIDYAAGTITFTQNRLITAETEIMVEFEYTLDNYRRDIYGLRGLYNFSQGLSLGLSYFSEGDNPYAPVIELDEQDYEKLEKESLNKLNEIGIPPPTGEYLVGIDGKYKIANTSLAGEIAYSSFDLNKLSQRDKQKEGIIKDGVAGKLNLTSQFQNLSLGKISLGNITLTGNYRSQDSDFYSLSRQLPLDFRQRWNIISTEENPQIRNFEGGINYTPHPFLTLSGNYGEMNQIFVDTKTVSDLQEYSAILSLPNQLRIRGSYDEVNKIFSFSNPSEFDENQARLRREVGLTYPFRFLESSVSFLEEENTTDKKNDQIIDSGQLLQTTNAGLNIKGGRFFTGGIDYSLITNNQKEEINTPWQKSSLAQEYKYRVSLGEGRKFLTTANLTQRKKNFYLETKNDEITTLGNFQARIQPLNILATNFRYDLNNELTTQKTLDEEGNIIPLLDEEGNPVQDSILNLESSLDLKLTPYIFSSQMNNFLSRSLVNWSLESYLWVDEETKSQPHQEVLLFRERATSETLKSSTRYKYVFSLLPRSSIISLSTEYDTGTTYTQQVEGQWGTDWNESLTYRAKSSFASNVTLNAQMRQQNSSAQTEDTEICKIISTKESQVTNYLIELNYRLRSWQLGLGGQKDISDTLEISQQTKTKKDSFNCRLGYFFTSKGKIEGDYRWEMQEQTPVNPEIVGITQKFSLLSNYNLSDYLNFSLSYTATFQPDKPIRHEGRTEVSLYF